MRLGQHPRAPRCTAAFCKIRDMPLLISTCIDPSRFRQTWPPHLLLRHCLLRPRQSSADQQNFVRGRTPQRLKQYNEKEEVARFYNCPPCRTPHLPRERATPPRPWAASAARSATQEQECETTICNQGHKLAIGGLRLRELASTNVELPVGAERLQPLPLRPCGRLLPQT